LSALAQSVPVTPGPRTHHDPRRDLPPRDHPDGDRSGRPTAIGIGTGGRQRLTDPGAARALAFAAEQLGYASVWTFDTPFGARRALPALAGSPLVDDVLATLATFTGSTSRITVGAAITDHAWPLAAAAVERLAGIDSASGGRVVVARPWSGTTDGDAPGRLLQRWSPEEPLLAAWADGWMVDGWERSPRGPVGRAPAELDPAGPGRGTTSPAAGGIVVRLPVDDSVDRIVADITGLRAAGATELVLDVVADAGVDQALDLYSRIAVAVEAGLDRRTA
jgi:hypothetical protein